MTEINITIETMDKETMDKETIEVNVLDDKEDEEEFLIYPKFNLYSGQNYRDSIHHAQTWEEQNRAYYTGFLCCKSINNKKNSALTVKTAYDKIQHRITNSLEEITSKIVKPICILARDHKGKCCDNIHDKMFASLPSRAKDKIDTAIYSSPGNDDYVYKNRTNRSFPIVINEADEKKLRDKKIKLSCAIPLKDYSTPLMQASAYIDFITFVLNIRGVREQVNMDIYGAYVAILDHHKQELDSGFKLIRRKLFNNEGFTICPVTGHEFEIEDISRDSRFNPQPCDVQMGHCVPRNEHQFTLRGFNICLMTREGNRFIGDENFLENVWIAKMRSVVSFQDAI
jgi:hypothetical protein